MKFRHLLLLSMIYSAASLADQLSTFSPVMCIDHYPPLQIVLPSGNATGENVEIAKAFFNNAGYPLTFSGNVPFKRCLQWLREGKVDVMAGLIYSQQRAADFNLYLYDDVTIKMFFIGKNAPDITSFDDLKKKRVAAVRGVRNFERFDTASRREVIKIPVDTLENAFAMLAKDRVDAVVATDFYGENILKNDPSIDKLIRKASFKVESGTKTYIAVSKKSPLNQDHQKLQLLSEKMYQSGEFERYKTHFQDGNTDLY